MYLFTSNTLRVIISALITKQKSLKISLDLGLSYKKLSLKNNNLILPNGSSIGLKHLVKLRLKEKDLYYWDDGEIKKFYFFSGKGYKLIPTKTWTTLTINSTPMHRYTFIDPKTDTELKIELVQPVGSVLDTCMGLGYTAILASETSDHVITFEKDKNVIEIAKLNPFSKRLFNSKKIQIKKEDVFYGIKGFPDEYFDRVIHDPPTLKYAGELYSDEFYREVFRVLKQGGIAYFYVPRPGIRKHKANLQKSIMERLRKIGFKVDYTEKAQGIKGCK